MHWRSPLPVGTPARVHDVRSGDGQRSRGRLHSTPRLLPQPFGATGRSLLDLCPVGGCRGAGCRVLHPGSPARSGHVRSVDALRLHGRPGLTPNHPHCLPPPTRLRPAAHPCCLTAAPLSHPFTLNPHRRADGIQRFRYYNRYADSLPLPVNCQGLRQSGSASPKDSRRALDSGRTFQRDLATPAQPPKARPAFTELRGALIRTRVRIREIYTTAPWGRIRFANYSLSYASARTFH